MEEPILQKIEKFKADVTEFKPYTSSFPVIKPAKEIEGIDMTKKEKLDVTEFKSYTGPFPVIKPKKELSKEDLKIVKL